MKFLPLRVISCFSFASAWVNVIAHCLPLFNVIVRSPLRSSPVFVSAVTSIFCHSPLPFPFSGDIFIHSGCSAVQEDSVAMLMILVVVSAVNLSDEAERAIVSSVTSFAQLTLSRQVMTNAVSFIKECIMTVISFSSNLH